MYSLTGALTGALPVLGGSGGAAGISAALSYRRNVSRDSSIDSDEAGAGSFPTLPRSVSVSGQHLKNMFEILRVFCLHYRSNLCYFQMKKRAKIE